MLLMSLAARHTSHITRHTSHITHHTSHVTRHPSALWPAAAEVALWPQQVVHVMAAGASVCLRVRARVFVID